jgi:hypothetical protein
VDQQFDTVSGRGVVLDGVTRGFDMDVEFIGFYFVL